MSHRLAPISLESTVVESKSFHRKYTYILTRALSTGIDSTLPTGLSTVLGLSMEIS